MPEPIMITLELSNERSVQIRRCCARPVPLTSPTTRNPNSGLWQCTISCARCRAELLIMRWKLPATTTAVPLDTINDPAHIDCPAHGSDHSGLKCLDCPACVGSPIVNMLDGDPGPIS